MAGYTNRITSKDMRVEFLPNGVAQNHIFVLGISGGSASGNFKLRVNGQLTPTIAVTGGAATAANVSSALATLKNPDGTAMVASTDFEITGTNTPLTIEFKGKNAQRYFVIRVEDSTLGTTGTVYLQTTQQGAGLIVLSADMSSFDYSLSTDSVDVTAISEVETNMLGVKTDMTWSLSMYNASQDYLYVLGSEILYGTITVYPRGLGSGYEYFSFNTLKEEFSETYPDHEKVEINISGRRVGAMVIPFGAKQP